MFVHSLYFWLKEDLSDEKIQEFKEALRGLKVIEVLEQVWVGDPVESERPVVDSSYTVGLVTVFKNAADHDTYQNHEAHQKFLTHYASCWNQVKVLDFSTD